MTRVLSLLTISCVVVVGCSNGPTQPVERPTGIFALRTVGGQAVPAKKWDGPFSETYVADTIRFDPNSLALFSDPTLERVTVVRDPGGTEHTFTSYVTYEQSGAVLHFPFTCPPFADCAVPDFTQGAIVGSQLTLTASSGLRTPLIYERIQ